MKDSGKSASTHLPHHFLEIQFSYIAIRKTFVEFYWYCLALLLGIWLTRIFEKSPFVEKKAFLLDISFGHCTVICNH